MARGSTARADWTPFHEPIGHTLARNVALALLVGAAWALRAGELRILVPVSLLALWFSLGGHYVEVLFLNGLRPRIPRARLAQVFARLALWFVGGALLFLLMASTARALPIRAPSFGLWWFGGLALMGIEFVVHVSLALRGLPNFYAGTG